MQDNNGGKGKQGGLSWTTPSTPAHTPHSAPKHASPAPTSGGGKGPVPSSAGKYVGMVVVGVLAGVIIAWGWNAMRNNSGVAQNDTQQTGNATSTNGANSNDRHASGGSNLGVNTGSIPALGSDPGLSIMSPQPAGMSVAISKAIVSAPTWVVVYENKEGTPGNALGAALFFPERQAGTVELLRATVPGRSYLVVKQVDNGDRKFSLKDDTFLSEGGEVQWVTVEVR